jgi:hypothetical protein
MSIVSQKTSLKSLRYGKDRIGGGSSNQPYIKSEIPNNSSSLDRSGGVDFLLRGGILTPSRAAKDVSRLTKMFFDFKSPNGVLFTAKQNLLSRTGVKTQASGILNEGAYLPTSTILQAAGNAFGTHLNKQGLNPFRNTSPDATNGIFGLRDPLGLPVYSQIIKNIQSPRNNRLVQLANNKLNVSISPLPRANLGLSGLIFSNIGSAVSNILSLSPQISSNPNEILKYGGGPGSTLGVGKTTIKRYTDTQQGIKNSKDSKYESKYYGITPFQTEINKLKNPVVLETGKSIPTITSKQGIFTLRNSYLYSNTNGGLDFAKNPNFKGKYYTLDSKTIFEKTSSKDSTQVSDFRVNLLTQQNTGNKKNILSKSIDYSKKNIENRVNLGNPGRRNKNVTSYTQGLGEPLDKITSTPLYQSSKGNHREDKNDLVKFSIGIINNNSPNLRTYIHFRAFLDSMDDNYAADWNSFKYMGRGESFYRYNGFTRSINLSWTVAAQSKEELIPMYQKLNYLASSLTPDYSKNGYMRGNLAVLTVGGYLFEQPGVINSINYSIPTESPWEIGINDEQGDKFGNDPTVKELPHIIRVTGFNFIPIHTFVPRIQQNVYNGAGNLDNTKLLGNERYIALSNGANTNYRSSTNVISSPQRQLDNTIVLPNNTQGIILSR